MRLEKATELLKLARGLAATHEGMTLDEMAGAASVDRRTAERMRDAIRALFPQMEEVLEGRTKRFRIPGGLDGFAQTPTADELAELQVTIRALEAGGGQPRADLLRSLSDKIRAALRAPVRRRLDPDIDALTTSEGLVMQAGPRPLANPETLTRLREALKSQRLCRFRYAGARGQRLHQREVVPYGILFGRSYYLVGRAIGKSDVRLWRFDRIRDLALAGPSPGTPPEFSLEAYAAQSFGTYQEERSQIVLRFSPEAAPDARRFLFHPTQTVDDEADGTLIVRFRAGGLLELARHLFTWGDAVEIIEPNRLRDIMRTELKKTLKKHDVS